MIHKAYKTGIPLMLGVLSLIVLMAPEILGKIVGRGINLSILGFIVWAVIMLASSASGLIYGLYLIGKQRSSIGRASVAVGIASCLFVGTIEAKMLFFLLAGGG
jgi:hypothetical protein